mmetsp:Transcript_4641/g.5352  ORF Transcript_4641/g.5352 Transcript_4641/m.5352 type:complete len:617 (-) Transcript_4641:805-2655(-)
MGDELESKIQFYIFLKENKLTLEVKKNKPKKAKGKAKEKAPVVKLDRALVPPTCVSKEKADKAASEKFYITTAINYTNGAPHLGHAYEAVTTDVIARYHRGYGRSVFFLTGSDEHGQKVEQKAESLGMTPKEVCDMYVKGFKDLLTTLNISNDSYIRTTDKHHEEFVRKLWLKVREKGDIYLKDYVGWYNVHEEQYVTDLEAEKNGYKDEYGRPYEKKEEESYFFRMSKYQKPLLEHFQKHPEFCQPESRRKEILSFLSGELHDLCISRTVCQWGVTCPPDPDYKGDKSHVMYVWFDALSNYLSGIGYWSNGKNVKDNSSFWPVNVHIIGKDIIRFHCVYWPCMLMSAGIPLPKSVFGHGFVNDKDGMKMSKSLGNVIDPMVTAEKYPVDAFRFYLTKECTYGGDLPFNEEAMCSLFNAVHVSGIGNLLHRATSLCQSYSEGKIPSQPAYKLDGKFPFDLQSDLVIPFEKHLCVEGEFQMQNAAESLVSAINSANKYLQDAAPWKIKDASQEGTKLAIVRTVLEAVYYLAHFLEPFSPSGAVGIFEKLGVQPVKICELSSEYDNLPAGTSTYVGEVLYNAIEKKEEAKTDEKKEGKKDGKKNGKKDKKKKTPKTEK